MRNAYVVAAKRTPVAPRNGALSQCSVSDLCAPVISAVLRTAGLEERSVDQVIMGNALYGGGNPARIAALAAGLANSVYATTLDTQCCAGLDAINQAAVVVSAGMADVVVAGGLESYSRSPIRQHRPRNEHELAREYQRPPFTPWPERDPDMLESAANLARLEGVSRTTQEAYAIRSHQKALNDGARASEAVEVAGLASDSFTRKLTPKLCARTPLLCGDEATGLTASTVAVEADAAACVVIVAEEMLTDVSRSIRPVAIEASRSEGADPSVPSLAPIAAIRHLLARTGVRSEQLQCAEIMEAFAVQAMLCIKHADIDPVIVNRGGGALARGHPIGASGTILAVRLWHELQTGESDALGLAAIAAAGGLGSATLFRAI